MAKWVRSSNGHIFVNVEKIVSLHIERWASMIKGKPDGFKITINNNIIFEVFSTYEKAEQFIKDFIAEHYITTEKV